VHQSQPNNFASDLAIKSASMTNPIKITIRSSMGTLFIL